MAGLNTCFIKHKTSAADRKLINELVAEEGGKVKALEVFRDDIKQDIADLREKYINPALKKAGIDSTPKVETKTTPKKEESIPDKKVEPVKSTPAPIVDFIKASAEQFPVAISNITETLANVAGKTIEALLSINSAGINLVPDSAFKSSDALVEALVNLKIPKESAQILAKDFKQFVFSYNKIALNEDTKAFAIRQPLTMLYRDSSGKVPPQVLFSMMVNANSWIQQNTNSNVFMNDAAMQRFLYGTQNKGGLGADERSELKDLGHSWKLTSNMLGKSIASMLKISSKDKDTALFYDNLVTALGMAALETAQTSPDNKDSAPIIIDPKKWNFDEDFVEDRAFNNKETYLNIQVKKDIKISKERRTAFNEAMSILNKNGELDSQIPLQEAPTSVVSSIRNSFGGVPIKVAATLRKMQKVPWGVNDTMPLFKELAKSNMPALHALAELKDVNKSTSTDVWTAHAEASNKNKIDNITAILEQEEEGNLNNFFFKYRLMNQHRIMMDGHINPQNSKVARALVSPKVTKEIYTKENIHLFKIAVLSNLGFKLDKTIPTDIISAFDALMDDPLIIKAIAAIEDKKINKIAELAVEIQNKYGGDMSVLSALTALTKYADFHGGDVKSFSSDIMIEADGITNGFAMSIFQFPTMSEKRLEELFNVMGTYFGKTAAETTHLISGIYKTPGAKDVYFQLADHIVANSGLDIAQVYHDDDSQQFAERYEKTSAAINRIHPKLQGDSFRDFVKNPFIVSQYGAGVTSITESIAEEIILEVYKRIGEFQADYDSLAPNEKQGYIDSVVAPYQTEMTNLGIILTGRKGPTTLSHVIKTSYVDQTTGKHLSTAITFDPAPVRKNVIETLSPRFNAGLSLLLGDSKESRDAVTKAGEVLNAVFNVHLKKEIAGKKLSPSQVNELVRTVLIKWLPQYKGPLMSLNEKAFIDLSKQVTDKFHKGSSADTVEFAYKNDKGKKATRSNVPTAKKFVNPGPAALIRLIINMDSSLMTAALNVEPNILSIYDGIIGSPSRVARASRVYGEKYLKFGMEHSVMQNIHDQMEKVIADTREEDKANGTNLMAEVAEELRKTGFHNTGEGRVNLEESIDTVRKESAKVAAARAVLIEKIKRLGAKSHQMFMADIASSNPAAGRSFNEQNQAILNALAIKQKEIFFSLAPVKAFVSPAKKAIQELFQKIGTSAALDILKEYTPENAFEYIQIAKQDKGNADVSNALAAISNFLQGESAVSPETVLTSFLQNDDSNQLAVEEFTTFIGEDNIDRTRRSIVNELSRYAIAPDFTESNAIFDKQIEDLKVELLSLNDLPRENVEQVGSFDINSNTITRLFKKFNSLSADYYDSVEARKSHTEVLKNVMDSLAKGIEIVAGVKLNIEEIDGITQGQYNKTREKIRVSMSRQPPAAANGQSPQEVYVHELLHAVTTHALESNSLIAARIEKAYKHVKSVIDADGKYRVFLRDIANPTPADIEMAKRQYNYLFDNPKNETNRLAEFLAYSTTNKALVAYLQNHTTPLPVREAGVLGWLKSLVDLVIDGFTRLLRKASGNNIHQDMVAVVEQLIEIQQVNESRSRRLFDNYVRTSDTYDERLRNIAENLKNSVANSAVASTFKVASGAVINNIKLHMSSNTVSGIILREAHRIFATALTSIAKELGEGVLTRDLITQLLQVKNTISKQNQILEQDIQKWFENIWKAPNAAENITAEQQSALTDVFLRTELSSLLGANLSPIQIATLLSNPKLIESNLTKLRQLMNLPRNHRAILYAEELGNYMATGKTLLDDAHQNVATIAKDELTSEQSKDINLLKRLKAYASLVALQKTSSNSIRLVKPLVDAEFIANSSENAIVDILQYHLRFTDISLKNLFNGNPMQTRQGWIIERVDNLTDMKTGTRAQAEEMRRAGYPEAYKLGKIPGVPSAHDTIYIGRNVPEARFVSGILSMTGRHSAGTTIRDILTKNPDFQKPNGSPDHAKIRKHISRIKRDRGIKAKFLKENPKTKLRPLRDDKGNIVDYRVEMDVESKQRLLKPDTAFKHVFAHMHSSASNRHQTIISDKDTIDLLVHEQVNLMPSMPEGSFVDILGPNSPFSRDRYNRLPTEVKFYLNQYAVNGEFKVRSDIIDKVFGFPAWDIGNLESLQGPARGRWRWAARMGQYMAQTVVSYGVDRIVIGTGSVVAGNLMSNMFALMMRKISPAYIVRKTFEGYQAYLTYQEDSATMRRLKREIEAKNLPNTSDEAKEFFVVKTRRENNKIHRMSEAGLDSLIVEDLNEASTSGYFSRYKKILQQEKHRGLREAIPSSLVELGKIAFMTKSSAPYRGLKHVVQLSDFLARYVMIEHATEVKGQDFNTAMFEAINAFVLFDENLTPGLDALNSVAGTLFVSYWLRNQRAARALIRNSPTTVLASAGIQRTTDIDTLASINSSIYGLDFSPNILQAGNVAEKVTEVTGLANAGDLANLNFFTNFS